MNECRAVGCYNLQSDDDIQFFQFPVDGKRRGFSLQGALEMAYGKDVTAIYIEPATAVVSTDEDSGEKYSIGSVDNVSGSQLRAAAEISSVCSCLFKSIKFEMSTSNTETSSQNNKSSGGKTQPPEIKKKRRRNQKNLSGFKETHRKAQSPVLLSKKNIYKI
ncbi:hypothetical protein JTB14_018715 [Gonioctena quinquepunctata]|nr:hypothetical protein JTB14_018715 [Gonioctena quinquepunctata]